jgi:hypothetical protein
LFRNGKDCNKENVSVPCNDVTEVIEASVDSADCLKEYRLSKRTCGQAVGEEALLLDVLRGRSLDDILSLDPEAFAQAHPAPDEIHQFLQLKHLFALQSALAVLAGRATGGPGQACSAASIRMEGEDVVIDGRIYVDILTEKIKSCGNCGSCGSTKAAAVPA